MSIEKLDEMMDEETERAIWGVIRQASYRGDAVAALRSRIGELIEQARNEAVVPMCGAKEFVYACTLLAGHPGNHVAEGPTPILYEWKSR